MPRSSMTQAIGFDIVIRLKALKIFSIYLIFFLHLNKIVNNPLYNTDQYTSQH
jgi:hypothetical protein